MARSAAALAMAVGLSGGCNLHQEGVRPPDNRIFFPGGAIMESVGTGAGKWLYVVNSNSDLRYNAGTVVAVNLARVRQDYPFDQARVDADGAPKRWSACPRDSRFVPRARVGADDRCCWDFLDPNILSCDEQVYISADSSVRIGNFGGRPVMQLLPQLPRGAPGGRRLFVPVRGDASIGMINVAASAEEVKFSCTGSRTDAADTHGQFPVCDADWQITRAHNPVAMRLPDADVLRLPNEPYALAVDDELELLYVGHLRGGSVSLIDLGNGEHSRTPELLQIYPNLLPSDGGGAQGVTSLTIRDKDDDCNGAIYVSSRFVPVVGSFVIYGLPSCDRVPDDAESARGVSIVGTGQFLTTGLQGTETRGVEFVRSARGQQPDRAFILQRSPPALVAVNTATQLPFATIEVCQSPTNLVQHVDAAGRTTALFVTCFDAGEVFVVDPWLLSLRTVVTVGRGPVSTVVPPPDVSSDDADRAYVVGFGANNISVIDLAPESPTQYRVIQRIGFSSPTPREVGPR